MIDGGLARKSINRHVGRIRQMFTWAAENELIDPTHPQRLQCVKGLRRGQGGRETPKVRPLAWAAVRRIAPYVSGQVWTMVRLQWLTGMRPGSVRIMRTADLEMDGAVWLYRPATFKTEHHDEDAELIIAIGPQAQESLKPWLRANLAEPLFQPADAEGDRNAQRRRAVTGPRAPSKAPRRRRARRRRTPPGQQYTTASYRRAIQRACRQEAADAWQALHGRGSHLADEHAEEFAAFAAERTWHPHRLRHSFATRARKRFGLDPTRAALGHQDAKVTLDYAEIDTGKAIDVARRIG